MSERCVVEKCKNVPTIAEYTIPQTGRKIRLCAAHAAVGALAYTPEGRILVVGESESEGIPWFCDICKTNVISPASSSAPLICPLCNAPRKGAL